MNYKIQKTSSFSQDFKRVMRRGDLDLDDFAQALEILAESGTLPDEYKTHKLRKDYSGVYDSHLDEDLLILWKRNRNVITLLRMGTHEDLFG